LVRVGEAELVGVRRAPICYPGQCDFHGELERAGVEGVYNFGRREIGKFRLLGAGFRGLVFLARWRGKVVALKVRRTDCPCDMRKEARIQKLAWPVAPKVYYSHQDFIVMEFIPYPGVESVLEMEAKELRETIKAVLVAGRALDKKGIDHGELVRPWKHVRIGDRVVFLDFGSASTMRKPSNVTSLLSGLLLKPSPPAYWIAEKLKVNKAELLEAARRYKRSPSEEAFEHILKVLG